MKNQSIMARGAPRGEARAEPGTQDRNDDEKRCAVIQGWVGGDTVLDEIARENP